MLAAHSLGVASCLIARATETFISDRGKEIQEIWGIDDSYEAKTHVILGYPNVELPKPKERKLDYCIIIK